MESYTFGSDEFMQAIALERMRTGENYPITLNDKDFRIITEILRQIALYTEIDHHKLNSMLEDGSHPADEIDPISDWAWSWLSGIAETLAVEGI